MCSLMTYEDDGEKKTRKKVKGLDFFSKKTANQSRLFWEGVWNLAFFHCYLNNNADHCQRFYIFYEL
ncbi:Uncharacterized protein FWK35_00034341 [Aphis craccivora]|uniref:Uncharacterized protein n=1 Tax=Aphis craccivora TaxID=307492 RepID=A0A6G0VKX2_APHCR|nr:Uncharacterized protein FWK35_00034341 [Aphis craccivora]